MSQGCQIALTQSRSDVPLGKTVIMTSLQLVLPTCLTCPPSCFAKDVLQREKERESDRKREMVLMGVEADQVRDSRENDKMPVYQVNPDWSGFHQLI